MGRHRLGCPRRCRDSSGTPSLTSIVQVTLPVGPILRLLPGVVGVRPPVRRPLLPPAPPGPACTGPFQAFGQALLAEATLGLGQAVQVDALHLATAALAGVQNLMTQNCTHIANATELPRIYKLLKEVGLSGMLVCAPIEFFGGTKHCTEVAEQPLPDGGSTPATG